VNRRRFASLALGVGIAVAGFACGGQRHESVDFVTPRLGGRTTAKALRGRLYNQSARNITNAELRRFGAGADVFDHDYSEADGLGPVYDEVGCLGCHRDGKQRPHDQIGPAGLIVRVSVPGVGEHGGPVPEPTYGLQMQTRATPQGVAEASISPRRVPVQHRWVNGERTTLFRLDLGLVPLQGPLAPGAGVSPRMAPPVIGLGLLEEIDERDLERATDPADADHDGISGELNRVWDDATDRMAVGRFGWKAGQPTVAQQTTVALHDDVGVTTPADPDACAHQGSACSAPDVPPELSQSSLDDMIFYNRTIAVPIARDVSPRRTRDGAAVFVAVGCAGCHSPTQHSSSSDIAALADETFHPYTDLLLHDLGAGLDDGRREYLASGREWRTAPLWGIGRRAEVTGSNGLLHDGRARSVTEAVLWHDGEAKRARLRFEGLSTGDRDDLLAFVDTL